MKLPSLILALLSVSIIVFVNLYQMLIIFTQPKLNIIFITSFIMIFLGVTIYAYHQKNNGPPHTKVCGL